MKWPRIKSENLIKEAEMKNNKKIFLCGRNVGSCLFHYHNLLYKYNKVCTFLDYCLAVNVYKTVNTRSSSLTC